MKLLIRTLQLLGILTALSSPAAGAVQPGKPVTPTEHVSAVINEALDFLRDEGLDREAKWTGTAEVLARHFDFRSMSQSVLAAHWQAASPEEQLRFTEYFADYLEVIYRTRIEAYTNQRIEYLDERIRRGRATVDIAIVGESSRMPITFRLRDNNDEWLAYDVIAEGVSLVENYKETFRAILKAEGMDGLISDIEEKIATYRKKYGADRDIQ